MKRITQSPRFLAPAALAAIFLAAGFFPLAARAQAALSDSERAALQAELVQVEAEQAQAQADLDSARSKSNTLENAIGALRAKIRVEELDIQAKNLLIRTLGNSIADKQSVISDLENKIAQNREALAETIRDINTIDADSGFLMNILLSGTTLSGFLEDADQLHTLDQNIITFSQNLKQLEASTTVEKNNLTARQNATIDARYAIVQAETALKADQSQQARLLSISKNNEKAYATLVAEKKARIDAINAKLFALAGGSNPINFGQAYKYAQAAFAKTGVDPAFLLAILTQESNLGMNQGTCYLLDANTGEGTSVRTGHSLARVMSPTRDVPPFLAITNALGVNPYQTVVSCPQSVGWGGAMGPAQFIPSTWMLMSSRVASAVGITGMANPWNPEHAFMASALYLADLGASGGGYTAESNAACRYYSGSSCRASRLIRSYAENVMALAENIERTEIDPLKEI